MSVPGSLSDPSSSSPSERKAPVQPAAQLHVTFLPPPSESQGQSIRRAFPPRIAVLPPSPRGPIVDTQIGGGSSSSDVDASTAGRTPEEQVQPERPGSLRHLSWNSNVTEGSQSNEKHDASGRAVGKRSAVRYSTLPSSRTDCWNPLETRFGDELVAGLIKRRMRRRSQTGPPLSTSIEPQLTFRKTMTRRSPPSTPLSEDPPSTVVLSVEQRDRPPLRPSIPLLSDDKLRQKWVGVLREMFKDMAEQSDKKGRTMDKETFLKYFPLPGVLGERLYDLFDADGSQTIDFNEFFMGLSIIYNGSAEERRRFLFNMYDLDGNGRITREEIFSLLSHIPAAFRVLHQLAEQGINGPGSEDGVELDSSGRSQDFSSTLNDEPGFDQVSEIVNTVFSERDASIQGPPVDGGLTYEEFCAALENNPEISDLFNLFYDRGMPDLPVPHDTLTPTVLLRDKMSGFFRGREEGALERFHFLGIPWPCIVRRPSLTSGSSGTAVPCPSSSSLSRLPRSVDSDVLRLPSASSSPRTPSSSSDGEDSVEDLRRARTTPAGTHLSCPHIPIPRGSSHLSSDESYEPVGRQGALIGDDTAADGSMLDPVPLVSGWLYKVGRRFRLKHYRFFVVRDRFLYYYGNVRDPTPKKALFLQDAQAISVCHTERPNTYPFDIHLPSGRVHRLYAQTRRDRMIWVRALTRAARTSLVHDDYQLQSPVSRGSFGVVYRGVHKKTQLPVAIKILVKKDVGKEDREFLRTEVAIMRLVQHPNVVRLIDVYDTAQYLYVVMEWVRAGNVEAIARLLPEHSDHYCICSCWLEYEKRIRSQQNHHQQGIRNNNVQEGDPTEKGAFITRALVSERLALIVARGVLQALLYLHKRNIIHRDLKLENILVAAASDTLSLSPSSSLESLDVESDQSHPPHRRHSHTHVRQASDERLERTEQRSLSLSEEQLKEAPPLGSASRTGSDRPKSIPTTPASPKVKECKGTKSLRWSGSVDSSIVSEYVETCPCQQCDVCHRLFNLLDVKISDFGLSKILAPSAVASEQLGTLCYAAPEVILGKPYDQAVDLWSLGVVLYHILSGELPFEGSSDSAVADSVVRGVQNFYPTQIWDGIPKLAKDFITQLLQVDPSQRPTALACLDHSWLKERFSMVTGR